MHSTHCQDTWYSASKSLSNSLHIRWTAFQNSLNMIKRIKCAAEHYSNKKVQSIRHEWSTLMYNRHKGWTYQHAAKRNNRRPGLLETDKREEELPTGCICMYVEYSVCLAVCKCVVSHKRRPFRVLGKSRDNVDLLLHRTRGLLT